MEDSDLYARFEKYFTENGLTFEQAAKKIGVTKTTLFNWKNGSKIGPKGRYALLQILKQEGNAHIIPLSDLKPVPVYTIAQAAQISAKPFGDPAADSAMERTCNFIHPG